MIVSSTTEEALSDKSKESESGLNDGAFESERKRTGKFTVEHLKDTTNID